MGPVRPVGLGLPVVCLPLLCGRLLLNCALNRPLNILLVYTAYIYDYETHVHMLLMLYYSWLVIPANLTTPSLPTILVYDPCLSTFPTRQKVQKCVPLKPTHTRTIAHGWCVPDDACPARPGCGSTPYVNTRATTIFKYKNTVRAGDDRWGSP